ncbi:membrane protein [Lampropedia cohaerens]|uniref:Membrane protein n=1 Tax=Lampropedia cohaerens TaxID=1610491 RepID=A0A0U1Q0Z7_9BURK|nr:DUF2818 family protein [Lampropedia cohaerens]KKW68444.1 membrane protein [Lampropedia cohaerens]
MNMDAAIWLLIGLAVAAANAPFVSSRLLLVGPRSAGAKSPRWHMLELLLLYGVVGVIGRLFEAQVGQVASQGWAFYVITGCLFLTFAAPGFVYHYLWKRLARG